MDTEDGNIKALLILSLDPALYPSFHQVIYHIQAGPPASYYSMTVASLLTNTTKFGDGQDEATATQWAENVLLIFQPNSSLDFHIKHFQCSKLEVLPAYVKLIKLELAKTSSFCEQIFQSEFLKDSAAICFSSRFVAFGSDEDQHEVS